MVADPAGASHLLRDREHGNDLGAARRGSRSADLQARLEPHPPSILFLAGELHAAVRHGALDALTPRAVASRHGVFVDAYAARLRATAADPLVHLGADVVHSVLVSFALDWFGLPEEAGGRSPDLVEDLYATNRLFNFLAKDEIARSGAEARMRVRALIEEHLGATALARAWDRVNVPAGVQLSTVEFMLRSTVVTAGSALLSAMTAWSAEGLPSSLDVSDTARRHSPTLDTGRVTACPVELGGETIPSGETVCVFVGSPGADRPPSPPALTFGGGAHRCIGEQVVLVHLGALHEACASERSWLRGTATPVPERLPSFRGVREVVLRRPR